MLAAQSIKKLLGSPASNLPPWPPIELVVESFHCVDVADPYRWPEDQHLRHTGQWLVEQAVYTRAYFDGIPARQRIRKRIAQLLDRAIAGEPRKVPFRYFFVKQRARQEQPVMMGGGCADIPLVDLGEGTHETAGRRRHEHLECRPTSGHTPVQPQRAESRR